KGRCVGAQLGSRPRRARRRGSTTGPSLAFRAVATAGEAQQESHIRALFPNYGFHLDESGQGYLNAVRVGPAGTAPAPPPSRTSLVSTLGDEMRLQIHLWRRFRRSSPPMAMPV